MDQILSSKRQEPSVNTVLNPHAFQSVFKRNIAPPIRKHDLPTTGKLISSTSQLAYCLSLLKTTSLSKECLDKVEYDWLQSTINDPDERKQWQDMAADLIRAFIQVELKTPDVVAEIVCLSAVLPRNEFRQLLQAVINSIEHSVLIEVHLLDGLAQLLRNAAPGSIDGDDLDKLLDLLNARLKGTHQQFTQHSYQVVMMVSGLLDSMVDSQVRGLKHRQFHQSLTAYQKELEKGPDPFLAYQAAYTYQTLVYISDGNTILHVMIQHTGRVVQGILEVINEVVPLDLDGFLGKLKDIQETLGGVKDAVVLSSGDYQNPRTRIENRQRLLESLEEGFSIQQKSAWYPALRGLDALLQEGRLADFERLVRNAPCQQDPEFQWGVCQRLGQLAANLLWDTETRQCAISFLGELYSHNSAGGQPDYIKQWILDILTQLKGSSDSRIASHAKEHLHAMKKSDSAKLVNEEESLSVYPSMVTSLPQNRLLAAVHGETKVETSLHNLRSMRLRMRDSDQDVYISPRARSSLRATTYFDLTPNVEEFLSNNQKVLLILGDSGAGKSTFNRALETSLWEKYKDGRRIPLFIHLPTIANPEIDLIEKQLHRLYFTANQIKELKMDHRLVLICDGYDESQLRQNLYMSNQLNQPDGWQVQMIISCRTEYTGVLGYSYKDLFQPIDGIKDVDSELFQEAIVAPFNKEQIKDYIHQYVSLREPSWTPKNYLQVLSKIPNLQGLVENPFLLKIALDTLPTLVNINKDFSTTKITRVELYDEFVVQWLNRSEKRYENMVRDKSLNENDVKAFRKLSESGFRQSGISYMKRLATAIYEQNDGNPVVMFSEDGNKSKWKDEYFSMADGKNLLREAIPLVRLGDQYRFIHKSVLEYGLALAVFDRNQGKEGIHLNSSLPHHETDSTAPSTESSPSIQKTGDTLKLLPSDSPLKKTNFVGQPSILRFLTERVQQEPLFKDQLHKIIQLSKTDNLAHIAAANSITILVQAGVQFNGANLQGIKIPGADLRYGMFDSAQLEGANLQKVNLQNIWLRKAILSGAQITGAQFGELPFIQESSFVQICLYSPNGALYAVGLATGEISLYETQNWRRLGKLRGHSKEVRCLAFSATNSQLASGSNDCTVMLWDIDSCDCVHTLQGHSEEVTSIMYSPKGDQIASGSKDSTVWLWDVKTGDCKWRLHDHSKGITSIIYLPKRDQIASGSSDNTIKIWHVDSGNCIQTLRGHSQTITSLACSPDGNHIASGSDDTTVRLWDVDTGKCVNKLEGHASTVSSIVYSPSGNQIASGSWDKTVMLWSAMDGSCTHVLVGHRDIITRVVYSPKGNQIASGSWDKTIRLWDVEFGSCVQTLQGYNQGITSVVYSPSGDKIASGSWDKTLRLWDVVANNFIWATQGHSDHVTQVAYSPKGDHVASGSKDKSVRLWNVETGDCFRTLWGHDGHVTQVVYSPTGIQIASGSCDKTVRLWDVEAGNETRNLRGHDGSIISVVYSPNGGQIASGSSDNTVKLWDVTSGECTCTIPNYSGGIGSVLYLLEGYHLAIGSSDMAIRLVDISRDCIKTFQGHSGTIEIIVYSPTRSQIASGSDDKTLRLWDVETGKSVQTLEGHTWGITAICYSPDGNQVASGSWDKTVRLWDVEAGSCIQTLKGHSWKVTSVVYLLKGNQVASASWDKTLRLWSTKSGACLHIISSFDGGITSIAYRTYGDSHYLVTGSQDKSIRNWKIEEGDSYGATLCWSSSHEVLNVSDASFDNVKGLDRLNKALLGQRGALFTSSVAK